VKIISRLEVQDVLFISVESTESGSGQRDTKPIRKIISDPDRIRTFLDATAKTRIGDRGDGNNANGARMQYVVDFRVALRNDDSFEFSVDYAGANRPVQNLTGLIFPPWLNDSLAVWISQEIDR
jgi:hypothetical protein